LTLTVKTMSSDSQCQNKDLECKYCGHVACDKYRLRRHQNSTLYCLEIQKKLASEYDIKWYTCSCGKAYSTKSNMLLHEKKCKQKDIVSEKDKEIQSLKERLNYTENQLSIEQRVNSINKERIAELTAQLAIKEQNQQTITLTAISKPTTSNIRNTIKNTIIQNLTPITDDEMRQHLPQLTRKHIDAGAQGYAQFAMDFPLKDKLGIMDVSRKKLAWKNAEGNIVYDAEGSTLSEKFFRVIKERNETLFKEIFHDLQDRLGDAYERNDQDEADAIVELTDKLQTWRRESSQASRGIDNDLRSDFVRCLCTISIKNQ